jgi:cysteinyl-tRNA synthetase
MTYFHKAAIKIIILFILTSTFNTCSKNDIPIPEETDFRKEMRNFVKNISIYSKKIKPAFEIVPQNGVELVGKAEGDMIIPVTDYLSAIDGIGQEDLFYGYNKDDKATPEPITAELKTYLDLAKDKDNIKILITDYCSTHSKMDDSYTKNNSLGYISFAADHRELDNIPGYPIPLFNENQKVISSLQEAKNFLYLINTDNKFSSKQDFIDAVMNTNYDILITDLFFDGNALTTDEVLQLKKKSNGGKRLVICYMSIGEAEDYRYYWNEDWKPGNPSFIEKENPEWKGNYIVRYWQPEWQSIIYGNDNSYLKKILDAGFDGTYLDIIDAYEYFE